MSDGMKFHRANGTMRIEWDVIDPHGLVMVQTFERNTEALEAYRAASYARVLVERHINEYVMTPEEPDAS